MEKIQINKTGAIEYGLTNDYMFHMVFQKNIKVLKALISEVTGIPVETMTSVDVLNVIEPGEHVDDKTIVMDIKVKLNTDHIINLEMQVNNLYNWPERSLTYLCRNFDSLKTGKDYKNVPTAIHIGILDFHLQEFEKEFLAKYMMTNQKTHQVYTSKFQLYVLDLTMTKEENFEPEESEKELFRLAKVFKARTWEELKAMASENATVEEIVTTMYQMSDDERVRQACEARSRHEWELAAARYQGQEEGVVIGREEGVVIGREEGVVKKLVSQVIKKLKKSQAPSEIADALEEDIEPIENICRIALKYAPNYDEEAIIAEILK